MTNIPNHNPTDDVGRTHSRREYIGDVSVDSGMVAIVDPSYLTRTSGLFVADADKLYAECRDVGDGGVVPTRHGVPLAVSLRSFGGDGVFPVYAERDARGLTTRVVIDFSRNPIGCGDHVGEAARFDHGITDDATIIGVSTRGDGIVDESAITDAAIMAELLEGDDVDDESAILDGPQGIASRLRELPDDFADFAHEKVDELIRVAHEADAFVESGKPFPHLYRRAGLQAMVMAGFGHTPHVDVATQVRRDTTVETALHNLVDAIIASYAVRDVVSEAQLDASAAMRALRSADVVFIDENGRAS